jgi:hypothetical protein
VLSPARPARSTLDTRPELPVHSYPGDRHHLTLRHRSDGASDSDWRDCAIRFNETAYGLESAATLSSPHRHLSAPSLADALHPVRRLALTCPDSLSAEDIGVTERRRQEPGLQESNTFLWTNNE